MGAASKWRGIIKNEATEVGYGILFSKENNIKNSIGEFGVENGRWRKSELSKVQNQ